MWHYKYFEPTLTKRKRIEERKEKIETSDGEQDNSDSEGSI